MTWDLALNSRGTLGNGIVTGDDEVLQRLWIRLNRELGEWFLNTEVGLPWYQAGCGILGSKPSRKNDVDLLIRNEIINTDGINQIVSYSSTYIGATRALSITAKILLDAAYKTYDLNFTVDTSGSTNMPLISASAIIFEDGRSLQELYDSGELHGKDGLDGLSATIEVGTTTTGAAGTDAAVVNSGTSSAAVLDFTIPRGEDGMDGAAGSISIKSTDTIKAELTTDDTTGNSTYELNVIDNSHKHTIDDVTDLRDALNNMSGGGAMPLGWAYRASNTYTNESWYKIAEYTVTDTHENYAEFHWTMNAYSLRAGGVFTVEFATSKDATTNKVSSHKNKLIWTHITEAAIDTEDDALVSTLDANTNNLVKFTYTQVDDSTILYELWANPNVNAVHWTLCTIQLMQSFSTWPATQCKDTSSAWTLYQANSPTEISSTAITANASVVTENQTTTSVRVGQNLYARFGDILFSATSRWQGTLLIQCIDNSAIGVLTITISRNTGKILADWVYKSKAFTLDDSIILAYDSTTFSAKTGEMYVYLYAGNTSSSTLFTCKCLSGTSTWSGTYTNRLRLYTRRAVSDATDKGDTIDSTLTKLVPGDATMSSDLLDGGLWT